jgi:myosin heavy subunit
VQDNLRRCKAEYKEEGIELFDYKLIDNSPVLDLLEGRSGVISALNEESNRPNGSNEVRTTMLCRTFRSIVFSVAFTYTSHSLHYPMFVPSGVCS